MLLFDLNMSSQFKFICEQVMLTPWDQGSHTTMHELHENLPLPHILFHANLIFWYWQEADFTNYN